MKITKIALLLALTATTVTPMNRFCSRFITKEFAKMALSKSKSAFSESMTGLAWVISFGPMIQLALNEASAGEVFSDRSEFLTKNKIIYEVSESTKQFVKETLGKEVDVKAIDSRWLNDIATATTRRIYINHAEATYIDNLKTQQYKLRTKKKLSLEDQENLAQTEDILNRYKFVVHHEDAHRKNRDYGQYIAIACTIPLGTHFIAKRMIGKIASYIPKKITIPFPVRDIGKISLAFTKLFTSFSLYCAYKRHREQEADNSVPNNRDILRGAVTASKIFEEKERKQKQKKFWLFNVHPTWKQRRKKFEQRLQKLKKQQNQV